MDMETIRTVLLIALAFAGLGVGFAVLKYLSFIGGIIEEYHETRNVGLIIVSVLYGFVVATMVIAYFYGVYSI